MFTSKQEIFQSIILKVRQWMNHAVEAIEHGLGKSYSLFACFI